jgi:glycosyltransferase involved in cell wall biosynthesis
LRKLSVAIITFNEEKNIERALKSVDFADEIIVVDSFSTDATVEICKKYTDNVTLREFKGHIDQKNHALSLTANDWVLSIDADEEVTAKLKENIIAVLKSDGVKDAYKMPRRSFYLGRWVRFSGWYPDYNVRLVNKNKSKWGGIDPHDKMMVDGECGTLKGDLLHYPYKDIAHHLDTINKYTSIAAGRLYEKGKTTSVLNIAVRPVFTFIKKFFLKLGFLDGVAGFVIAVSTAFYTFSKYLKLYDLAKKRKENEPHK